MGRGLLGEDPADPPRSRCADSRELGPPIPAVSEGEFEEIMNRNRAISSSAISKAVSGASAGTSRVPRVPHPGMDSRS